MVNVGKNGTNVNSERKSKLLFKILSFVKNIHV